MNLTIISCFRNSDTRGETARYLAQIDALCRAVDSREVTIRLLAVEGDSTDGTRATLHDAAVQLELAHFHLDIDILDGSHGGYLPPLGDASKARLLQFGRTAQTAYDRVRPDDDFVINVESDLIWTPDVLLGLIETLKARPDIDILAPACWLGVRFYDIWAYRFPGEGPFSISAYFPYHPQVTMDGPFELASVGACVAMRGDVARTCRMDNDQAVMGFCAQARERGYRVWADFSVGVHHPVQGATA